MPYAAVDNRAISSHLNSRGILGVRQRSIIYHVVRSLLPASLYNTGLY